MKEQAEAVHTTCMIQSQACAFFELKRHENNWTVYFVFRSVLQCWVDTRMKWKRKRDFAEWLKACRHQNNNKAVVATKNRLHSTTSLQRQASIGNDRSWCSCITSSHPIVLSRWYAMIMDKFQKYNINNKTHHGFRENVVVVIHFRHRLLYSNRFLGNNTQRGE